MVTHWANSIKKPWNSFSRFQFANVSCPPQQIEKVTFSTWKTHVSSKWHLGISKDLNQCALCCAICSKCWAYHDAMFYSHREDVRQKSNCATDLFTKTIIQIEKVNCFVYMNYFSFKHNNLQIEGNSLDDQKKGCLISWKVQWGHGSKWLQVATENIELCQP